MIYDKVTKNIQYRHERIKHMNSFINARLQRKLRKFAENPLSGSRVSGPTYEMGPGSSVSDHTKSLGSRVPLFGYVKALR